MPKLISSPCPSLAPSTHSPNNGVPIEIGIVPASSGARSCGLRFFARPGGIVQRALRSASQYHFPRPSNVLQNLKRAFTSKSEFERLKLAILDLSRTISGGGYATQAERAAAIAIATANLDQVQASMSSDESIEQRAAKRMTHQCARLETAELRSLNHALQGMEDEDAVPANQADLPAFMQNLNQKTLLSDYGPIIRKQLDERVHGAALAALKRILKHRPGMQEGEPLRGLDQLCKETIGKPDPVSAHFAVLEAGLRRQIVRNHIKDSDLRELRQSLNNPLAIEAISHPDTLAGKLIQAYKEALGQVTTDRLDQCRPYWQQALTDPSPTLDAAAGNTNEQRIERAVDRIATSAFLDLRRLGLLHENARGEPTIPIQVLATAIAPLITQIDSAMQGQDALKAQKRDEIVDRLAILADVPTDQLAIHPDAQDPRIQRALKDVAA